MERGMIWFCNDVIRFFAMVNTSKVFFFLCGTPLQPMWNVSYGCRKKSSKTLKIDDDDDDVIIM